MGRGRAKAKQVKVARQLKYSGGGTDLDRLRAELGVGNERVANGGRDGYPAYGDHSATTDDESEDDSEYEYDYDEDEEEAGR